MQQLHSWSRNESANVSLMIAFSIALLLGAFGFGVDFYTQQSFKRRLDAAADAAALAAVTTAKSYSAHTSGDGGVASGVAAGIAAAQRVFAVNAGQVAQRLAVTPSVSFPLPTTPSYRANVSYATTMPTAFGRIINVPTLTIAGQATATVTYGQYSDVYVFMDVSGSMGVPTSSAEQKAFATINQPTGCAFACHYPGSSGYDLAKSNNVALRVDTVGSALSSALNAEQAREAQSGLSGQVRIGLYPFIVHAIDAAPINADFTQAQRVASSLGSTYLDQGWYWPPSGSNGTGIGSGGTHFDNLAEDFAAYLKTPLANGKVGDGSSPKAPAAFLFLITDGMDDGQTFWWRNQHLESSGASPQLPPVDLCQRAKGYGITVAVLYIPYLPINNPNPGYYDDEDDKANNVIPAIPAQLQSCASPGFFFTASESGDIQTSVQAMFTKALTSAGTDAIGGGLSR